MERRSPTGPQVRFDADRGTAVIVAAPPRREMSPVNPFEADAVAEQGRTLQVPERNQPKANRKPKLGGREKLALTALATLTAASALLGNNPERLEGPDRPAAVAMIDAGDIKLAQNPTELEVMRAGSPFDREGKESPTNFGDPLVPHGDVEKDKNDAGEQMFEGFNDLRKNRLPNDYAQFASFVANLPGLDLKGGVQPTAEDTTAIAQLAQFLKDNPTAYNDIYKQMDGKLGKAKFIGTEHVSTDELYASYGAKSANKDVFLDQNVNDDTDVYKIQFEDGSVWYVCEQCGQLKMAGSRPKPVEAPAPVQHQERPTMLMSDQPQWEDEEVRVEEDQVPEEHVEEVAPEPASPAPAPLPAPELLHIPTPQELGVIIENLTKPFLPPPADKHPEQSSRVPSMPNFNGNGGERFSVNPGDFSNINPGPAEQTRPNPVAPLLNGFSGGNSGGSGFGSGFNTGTNPGTRSSELLGSGGVGNAYSNNADQDTESDGAVGEG